MWNCAPCGTENELTAIACMCCGRFNTAPVSSTAPLEDTVASESSGKIAAGEQDKPPAPKWECTFCENETEIPDDECCGCGMEASDEAKAVIKKLMVRPALVEPAMIQCPDCSNQYPEGYLYESHKEGHAAYKAFMMQKNNFTVEKRPPPPPPVRRTNPGSIRPPYIPEWMGRPKVQYKYPAYWRTESRLVTVSDVEKDEALMPLLATLFGNFHGKRSLDVKSVERVQNKKVYDAYAAETVGSPETLMFHGCRTDANEQNIIEKGFLVNKCVSGGENFGTWFAYNAAYSDAGFAYKDRHGYTHLFVCAVAQKDVKLHNSTMRVVGPDNAYPMYLIVYKYN